MKKKVQAVSVDLPPIRIYLDELRMIETELKENCESYFIEVDESEYDFESVDELLTSRKNKVSDISLITRKPDIKIRLAKHFANLHGAENNIITMGLIEKLKSVLEAKQSIFYKFLLWKKSRIFFFSILVVLIGAEAIFLPYQFDVKFNIADLTFLLVVFVSLFQSFLFPHYSVVYLSERNTHQSLWRQIWIEYGGKIFIAVLSSVITTIVLKKLADF